MSVSISTALSLQKALVASQSHSRITVSPSNLPTGDNVIFPNSSFFRQNGSKASLPSIAEVRSQPLLSNHHIFLTTVFPDLDLVVKYGTGVTTTEGKCLWAIRNYLGDAVPVPEVYGWQTDEKETFIYMEQIHSPSLEDCWDTFSTEQRQHLCLHLREILSSLRGLKQETSDPFVGAIDRQHLHDIIFPDNEVVNSGPFDSVQAFHEYYSLAYIKMGNMHPDVVYNDAMRDPYWSNLPNDVPIIFTHGDLHPRNILVSLGDRLRVASLIDWHQSGWLPAYWEYFKTTFTADHNSEWYKTYIPSFIAKVDDDDIIHALWFYAGAIGNF